MKPILLPVLLFLGYMTGYSQNSPTAHHVNGSRSLSTTCCLRQKITGLLTQIRSGELLDWPAYSILMNRMEQLEKNLLEKQLARDPLFRLELLVLPTPDPDKFDISIKNTTKGDYNLKILNSSRQIVYFEFVHLDGTPYNKTLPLFYLPPGTYPVLISNEKGVVGPTRQLVVK